MAQRFALNAILTSPVLSLAFDNLDGSATKATVLPVNAAVARTLDQHLGLFADVADFLTPAMAAANDHTAAIQAALATGKPVRLLSGPMRVTGQLTCTTHGQVIRGHGRTVSVITVDAAFALASRGVFVAAMGEAGPEFVGFGIEFVQPDTTVFAALTAYPPAFLIDNTARTRWRDIRITRGYDGITLLGNCGGTSGLDIEMSCLRYNVCIDGCMDSVRFTSWHVWPFGLSLNHQSLFYAATCYGLHSGRCDDLHLTDCLWLCGRGTATYFYNSGTGPLQGMTFGTMLGCDWDTNGGLTVLDGNLSVIGGEITQGDGYSLGLDVRGGNVRVTGCWFTQAQIVPALTIANVTGGVVTLTGNEFTWAPDVQAITMRQGQISLIGNHFVDIQGVGARVQATIQLLGGSGTITGNTWHTFSGGIRTAVSMVGDQDFVVGANNLNGYGLASTVTPFLARFFENANAPTDLAGDAIVGALRSLVFEEYVVAADGTVAFPHNLNVANQRVVSIQGFYRGGSGGNSALPLTLLSVDVVRANFSGGVSGAAARVMLQYINQPQAGW